MVLQDSALQAQTIHLTATPGTEARENMPYTGSIQATSSNNDPLTYTAPVLPAWLSLSANGSVSGSKINNTPISNPAGVALDAQGNYYVVQNSGTTIYKIQPDGTTTIFAQRQPGSNYGALVIGNYLYVSYYGGSTGIQKFDLTQTNPAGQTIYATTGNLSMTYKDGYLYAAQYSKSKVIRINLADNTVSDYVTNVPGCFGLGFDPSGNLLIAQHSQNTVLKYNPQTQQVTPAISNISTLLTDVKIDAQGYTYVSLWPGKIRKYTPDHSSFIEITPESIVCLGMTMTESGVLIYGDLNGSNVYSLQTGVVLTGTPKHEDVGRHPVKVVITNGAVSLTHDFEITVSDPNPPVLTHYSPAFNSTQVPLLPVITATFNEQVVKGSGKINIINKSTNEIIQSVDVSTPAVIINNYSFSLPLTQVLPHSTDFYITIDAGAFRDVNNNPFAGISGLSWSFRTMEPTQHPQTIVFDPINTVVYGTAAYTPAAYSSSGLPVVYESLNPEIAAIIDGKIQPKKAGSVTIIATQPGNEEYFSASPVTQVLIISPAEISVSLMASPLISKEYDGSRSVQLSAANFQLNGLFNNDQVSVSGAGSYHDANAGTDKIITVTDLQLEGPDKDNYTLITKNATVAGKIQPKKLIITASDQSKVYGSADPQFTYNADGLINNDQLSGQLNRTAGNSVGNYAIGMGTLTAGNNYTINFTGAQLSITPAHLTINAENKTMTYGAAEPALTYTVKGLVQNDVLSGNLKRTAGINVGEYTISQGSLNAGANYIVLFNAATFTITPATLTVTAENKNKIYGTMDPALTYSVSGLVNGDVLNGSLLRTAGNNVGEYAILQGSLKGSANYNVEFTPAKFTITPATLTIAAENKTIPYGSAEPALTYTVNGLVNNDQLSGQLKRNGGSNVGVYSITQGTLYAGPNYLIGFTPATFTITPAVVTVSADNKIREYGAMDPEFTYQQNGLIGNDKLSGSLSRNSGENVGTYEIQQGSLSAGTNYTLQFNSAQLEITPAPLTIVAESKQKLYGTPDPELTYTVSGLKNHDQLSGVLESAGDKNVGVHAISLGSLSAGENYSIDYTPATLTITPAPLTITANNSSKVYGTADPEFTYSVTGLVNGDQLEGQLSRVAGKNVGTYTINQGTLNGGPNYAIEFTGAELEITPAPLVISAEHKTRDEWKEDPEFTFHYNGLMENDKPSDLTTMPKAKSTAVLNSGAGKYEIIPSGASSPNYTITYVKGELTVLSIDKNHVKAWSNGTTNLQIRIFSETTQNVSLMFVSATGQVIKIQKTYLKPGVNSISMPIGNVAPNIYVLQVNADKFKEAVRVKF